ncbi:3-isopropylmalate dehydratase subunit LeuD [Rhodovastum atsumiense]|uniref:3-isopropylmalate dehydratase n=1 Tax=Rhodovastum atsumiense TaxID=504468 RepID=A0A5M6IUP7_9PROT|nr:3-isopropylmalate dehydratase small subunit [Rhodovastum atsumiense]KAA5611951.1 3-isopropylmalate dehydratase small subunit [Rhodovastum atsumiense]CAH2598717.1 3-isopropylmalate dehydratase subunit LeuD [Rhodovastum atsumiense]
MQPFRRLTAIACPLPLTGVDTDQLIPARFMKRTRAEGYGDVLLHDLRFDAAGAPVPDFPLNHPQRQGAAILVTRRNFGTGSSREAAVYALADHGIRCVVAPSFGDIFAANAVNNGLLPARAEEADAEALLALLAGGLTDLTVDLDTCRIQAGEHAVSFAVDPVWRTKLLNGWDDIDLTLHHLPDIDAFVARDRVARPWATPPAA